MFHVEHLKTERMITLELTVYHVDAFTNVPFGGNPAGVVLDSKKLTTETMQLIANEMNLSETAFVKNKGDDRYYVRYFTPICEVGLCGHATIASFYTLAKQGYIKSIESGIKTVSLITNEFELDIDIEYKDRKPVNVTMEQSTPKSYGTLDSLDDILSVSNLKVEDIGFLNEGLGPEIMSTGLKDIILPLKTKEALDNLEFHMCELKDISKKLDVVGIHAFYLPEKDASQVFVRNFAPLVGIDEEAATGTANGALLHYLKTHGLVSGNRIVANQGEKMNRPSKIYCEIEDINGKRKIKVGGSANITIEGILKY